MEEDRIVIGSLIERTGRAIKRGECGLTKEEMYALCRIALREEWFLADLERRFKCSTRTIERWCNDGTLPPLRHRSDNRKFLYHDEVELWCLKHGEPHVKRWKKEGASPDTPSIT